MPVAIDAFETEVTATEERARAGVTERQPQPPGEPETTVRELARRVKRDADRTRAEGYDD
jgi:hypothetical protein